MPIIDRDSYDFGYRSGDFDTFRWWRSNWANDQFIIVDSLEKLKFLIECATALGLTVRKFELEDD